MNIVAKKSKDKDSLSTENISSAISLCKLHFNFSSTTPYIYGKQSYTIGKSKSF